MSSSDEKLQAIGEELIAMSEADQAMRRSSVWDASVDRRNTLRLQQIVADIGWPTITKVGQYASHMAWLLAQHADHDHDFQRTCLALMQAQPAGEVKPANIAYLEDRIRVGEKRPQLYGTQFYTNAQGELEPFPIENEAQVDERRAQVGLDTLAEYAVRLRTDRKSKP